MTSLCSLKIKNYDRSNCRTDGSSTNTYTADTTGTTYNSSDPLRFGADWAGGERLDGTLDEIRVHTTAVSDNYITTRFNNMNSPSTFWSIGSPSTNSGGGSYTETYTYSIIGNILTKTGQGSYMYAGTTTGNYANPHAVTKVGTSNYTYDNNGNLLTSPATTNTWDYRNRLIQTVASSTTTYGYDHNDNRVKYATASTTIYYPNQYYNISSATTTKQIFANNALIATITGTSTNATVHYVHTDHLGGSTLITNGSGVIEQSLDYYPYGSIRGNIKSTFDEQKKFAGSLYDPETQYNYMNARYQNPATGQFISEDPSFLSVGNPDQLKQFTGLDQSRYLADPQSMNSYSYARDNPINRTDPNGLYDALNGKVQKGDTLGMITQVINGINNTNYSVKQIANINGISNPNVIKVGQQIVPNMTFLPDISNSLMTTLHTNAAEPSIKSGLSGITAFYNNVKTGGPQDLKNQPGLYGSQTHTAYIFDGKIVNKDFPGNVNFGYVGNSTDWGSPSFLLHGAGGAQVLSNLGHGSFSSLSNPPYFDNSGDSREIMQGIQLYQNGR